MAEEKEVPRSLPNPVGGSPVDNDAVANAAFKENETALFNYLIEKMVVEKAMLAPGQYEPIRKEMEHGCVLRHRHAKWVHHNKEMLEKQGLSEDDWLLRCCLSGIEDSYKFEMEREQLDRVATVINMEITKFYVMKSKKILGLPVVPTFARLFGG